MPPLKSGHLTTEFWLTAGSGLCLTVLSCMQTLNSSNATAITVITALYTLMRSLLKNRQPKP